MHYNENLDFNFLTNTILMKKLLLSMAAVAMAMSASAGVDPSVYEPQGEYTLTNLWTVSRNLDAANSTAEFAAHQLYKFNNKVRSLAVLNDVILMPESQTIVVGEGESQSSNDYAHIHKYDLFTGAYLGAVQLTVGGEPLAGLLCANQIGIDDFGNVWLVGLTGDSNANPIKVYHVKDLNTGETELAFAVQVPEDEVTDESRRHDYYDLVGDVTRQQAGCVFMSPVAKGKNPDVFGINFEQGSDKPNGQFDDYFVVSISDTYPDGQTTWDGAPMVRIVRDEDHSGTLFYIDAFVTAPTLYDYSGTMLESFADVDAELTPKVGPNGCMEFTLDGEPYFMYTLRDYDTEPGSAVRMVKMGEGGGFEGMSLMWDFPANGLGTITDTGSRMFGMVPVIKTDSKGNEAVYIALCKCNGGMAVYRMAKPAFEASEFEAGVNDVVADADATAPIEYFNLQGVRIANPAAGQVVIARQGTKAAKQLVK